jgi:hypothetical protein
MEFSPSKTYFTFGQAKPVAQIPFWAGGSADEMTLDKQKAAAQKTTPREHALTLPEGSPRAEPGKKGAGDYFRIVVRPKKEFSTLRYEDVGEKGHILRLAGQRSSGTWDTQVWLISKNDAHLEGETLIAETEDAGGVLAALGSKPKQLEGDVFEAQDRPNFPENKKPSEAQPRSKSK